MEMIKYIAAEMLIMSLVLFVIMGLDKRKAKKGKWRIREKTLFLPAILGGALGGVVGMKVFHHKTKHRTFQYGFPALLIVQLALVVWLTVR